MDAKRPTRRGFTLVEILIVIVIIGMLMALALPAINAARRKAQEAVITTDISQLEMALNAYKDEYGDYPPDFFGVSDNSDSIRRPARAAVLRHLRKAYPRMHVPSNSDPDAAWDELCTHFMLHHPNFSLVDPNDPKKVDFNSLSPASALVFWLGGLPDAYQGDSSKQLRGFSPNPEHPFDATESSSNKLFDFDETRLRGFEVDDSDPTKSRWKSWPMYSSAKTKIPYVYFKPRTSGSSGRKEYAVDTSGGNGPMQPFYCKFDVTGAPIVDPQAANAATAENIAVPYLRDVKLKGAADVSEVAAERVWNNADTFQIISPGVDEMFGNQPVGAGAADYRNSRTGDNFSEDDGDLDNLTNFSEGRLEDGIEE